MKKQLSPDPLGSCGLLVAVLAGMGGGRAGNAEGAEVSQSGSESNPERVEEV